MLVQGSVRSERTNILINKYVELLDNNNDADSILVLVQNSYKKSFFINEVKNKLKTQYFTNPQITTFYGLCYNTILECWPQIENTIKIGKPTIIPKLNGLEISHLFWKDSIKEVGFNDYNSKINLVHQLFRRYSLITNNNLTNEEIENRSKILKESFGNDAKIAIDIFKKKSIEYRSFDYIRQIDIFKYITENTNYFSKIKYIIIDDADEITPIEFEFIKKLYPQLNEIFVGYDKNGSTRLGYLNTDTKTIENIEKFFSNERITNLDNINEVSQPLEKQSFSKRSEMIDESFLHIEKLIQSGTKPEDIAIVTPSIDTVIKSRCKEIFDIKNTKYCFLSGSEKLCDNNIIQNIFTILNLSFEVKTDIFKIRNIFNSVLELPIKYCLPVVEAYQNNNEIIFSDLKNGTYNNRLKSLIDTIKEVQNLKLLSEKTFKIYQNLIQNVKTDKETLSKITFLFKQINDFEPVFIEEKDKIEFQKTVLTQLENSIISENPSSAPEIEENSIIITTAQKIIDFSIRKKHLFLLDTTSAEWTKDDLGTLYNAWVFQKSWNKNSFEYEDNIENSELKTKKMLRKLLLLAEEKIYSYSSLYDTKGNENETGIDKFLEKSNDTQEIKDKQDFKFIPRDDQKPILEYKNGHLAISAVPGAGKTTVLLALILKLLENGTNSDNIFVLTYMESAARNFKERIQQACPNLEKLPNITTIHGLALRILKENSNFVKVGLDENFEICDDIQRQNILWELISLFNLTPDDFEKYERAISILKLTNEKTMNSNDIEIKKFFKFYNAYNKYLKNKNLIDYDDMLSYSVKILEQNPDIKEYYANNCKYIIEDEAQDSSEIQQCLLKILSSKYKNLIRCGDINQAITTTFTNSDTEGFKKFITKSTNIEMNKSQRCTKEVFELANRLVDYAKSKDNYKNAFYDIKMNPVAGKNPQSENAVDARIFEDFNKERSFILEKIRNIFVQKPNATVAILVRNNYQVEEYASYFKTFGYQIQTQNELMKNQPIFSLVQSLSNFLVHPWQNEMVENCATVFNEQKLIKLSSTDFEYIKSLKKPFILENPDNLSDKLSDFLWDLQYWLENSYLNAEEFTIKVGHHYYSSQTEKANTYITALLLKTIEAQYKTKESFVEKLNEISTKPLGNKFKFFEENKENIKNTKSGIIQIMTYHKSKGDEFDCVFIPELTEETLQFNLENIKIKSKERFIEAIKRLNLKYRSKNEQEQKIIQIEENLRLLYVAITRAKEKLYITSALKYKKYSRIKDTKPSILFEELLETKQC